MPSNVPKHDPADSLADIIENIRRIMTYVKGMERNEFARHDITRDAVERCLERVCEAAYRLGDEAAILMPDQPWGDIRGMGNKLRHAYDRISFDLLWNVVIHRLPALEVDAVDAQRRLRAQPHREGP